MGDLAAFFTCNPGDQSPFPEGSGFPFTGTFWKFGRWHGLFWLILGHTMRPQILLNENKLLDSDHRTEVTTWGSLGPGREREWLRTRDKGIWSLPGGW